LPEVSTYIPGGEKDSIRRVTRSLEKVFSIELSSYFIDFVCNKVKGVHISPRRREGFHEESYTKPGKSVFY